MEETLIELRQFNAHRKVEFWIKAWLAKKCAKKWIQFTRNRQQRQGNNHQHKGNFIVVFITYLLVIYYLSAISQPFIAVAVFITQIRKPLKLIMVIIRTPH